jgi:hypothetical protein
VRRWLRNSPDYSPGFNKMTAKPALFTPDAARLPGLSTTGKRPDPLNKKLGVVRFKAWLEGLNEPYA